MNAATVNGPRSRMTSSSTPAIFNASAIGNLKSAATAGRPPPEVAAGFGGGRHALPVDGENHVPLPERTGRRTVRVDVGDQRPGLAGRHVELPRPLRREVAQREA